MPAYCCVPQCNCAKARKSYRGQTFHRFPKDTVLRREWIHKIRRDPGRHFKIHDDTKVCSDHFTEESFENTPAGRRNLQKGAVPTLFAWSETMKPGRRVPIRRTESHDSTAVGEEEGEEEDMLQADENHEFSDERAPPHSDHDYVVLPPPAEEQLEEAHKTIREQAELIAQLQTKQFLLSRFQGDDKTIMFYTGFPNYDTLMAVFMALQPTAENMVGWGQAQRSKQADEGIVRQGFNIPKLATIDQFFLFLCRLRQGFPEQDLAVRFNVSQSTVSRICVTWVNYLYFMLGSLPIWPSREAVNELMPPSFKSTFPRTRVILDCTEIHVQRPSSKVLNSEVYSHYKGHTTLKGLIGISPSGEITFVSDLYTGSISDKEITKQSGILSLLEEGDEVMADKGFLIKDLLAEKNVSLVIPPFLGPSGHFSLEEVRQTQAIARLRIHVERAIRRIKEYHIFDRVLPMTLVGSVNQLWGVCALLTNFQGPLFVIAR